MKCQETFNITSLSAHVIETSFLKRECFDYCILEIAHSETQYLLKHWFFFVKFTIIIKMLTRSREKNVDSVPATTDVAKTPSKAKNNKHVEAISGGTPSKVAKAEDLVNNILNSIVKKNAEKSNELRGNEKKPPAGETTLLPKKKLAVPVRGQPKSGRPWKEVKQK